MASSILSGFALTAFVSVLPADQANANSDQEVVKYVGKALYKQLDVDDHIQRLEKRYLSKEIRKYGGAIGVGVRILTEQKISYVWKF